MLMERLTEGVLLDYLDKLAAQGTPQQIRDYLVREDIKGIRWSSYSCPVARYLNRELGTPRQLRAQVGLIQVALIVENIRVDTPPEVAMFISNFDLRVYPELVALPVEIDSEIGE